MINNQHYSELYLQLNYSSSIAEQYKTSLDWHYIKKPRLCFIGIRALNQGFSLICLFDGV